MVSERLQKATDDGFVAQRAFDEAKKALAKATRDLRTGGNGSARLMAQAQKQARHNRDAAIAAAIVAAKAEYRRESTRIMSTCGQTAALLQARSAAQKQYARARQELDQVTLAYRQAKREEPPAPNAELSTDQPAK